MMDEKAYECQICQSQRKVGADQDAPECCGQPMTPIPLDQCILSTTAEHARFDDLDDPCDDGRSG